MSSLQSLQSQFVFLPLADSLTLKPIKKITGEVQLPGSKSLSNRVLLLAALSKGSTKIINLLVSLVDLDGVIIFFILKDDI